MNSAVLLNGCKFSSRWAGRAHLIFSIQLVERATLRIGATHSKAQVLKSNLRLLHFCNLTGYSIGGNSFFNVPTYQTNSRSKLINRFGRGIDPRRTGWHSWPTAMRSPISMLRKGCGLGRESWLGRRGILSIRSQGVVLICIRVRPWHRKLVS